MWSAVVLLFFAAASAAQSPLESVLRETGMRPPRHGGIYVVAHRGAHDGIPENTLAAYQRAIDLGCDFVEVDVRATKDGTLVSIHNATVDAYTNGVKGAVRNFTLPELQAIDIGSRVGPQWREERVPTIQEVFALCRGKIGVYLDVKEPALVPKLLDMVREHGMKREVLWYTGLPQQQYVQENCRECLVMPDPGIERNLPATFTRLDRPPRIIASVMKFCSKSFVQTAHAQGAIVITDEGTSDDWPTMLEWGMDGIQTDDPERLIESLGSRSQE